MNNNVVARPPCVKEVEPVARVDVPVHSPPVTEAAGNPSSPPADRTVAAELDTMFYWLAMR